MFAALLALGTGCGSTSTTPSTSPAPTATAIAQLTPATLAPTTAQTNLPDLVVAGMSISLDTSCLAPGSQLGLRVTIKNVGEGAAGTFVVEANSVQQTSSAGLGAGQSTTLWFAGYRSGALNTATADATEVIDERDEANNRLAQMLPVPTPPLPCPTPAP